LVHAAVVLEQDAQHHRQTDKAAAQLELTSGLAALQHALALGAPAAAQADLRPIAISPTALTTNYPQPC